MVGISSNCSDPHEKGFSPSPAPLGPAAPSPKAETTPFWSRLRPRRQVLVVVLVGSPRGGREPAKRPPMVPELGGLGTGLETLASSKTVGTWEW